jgi:RNA polymerase sigma factor (sigma-70 family)
MRRSAVVVVISSEGPVNRDLVASLFERHRLPVYRFLRRLLRDGAVAEDLTQETFLRALSGRYHADGRERAWVFQIARNLARDHVRAGAEMGYEAAVPERAAFHDAPAAISFLYLITARG